MLHKVPRRLENIAIDVDHIIWNEYFADEGLTQVCREDVGDQTITPRINL